MRNITNYLDFNIVFCWELKLKQVTQNNITFPLVLWMCCVVPLQNPCNAASPSSAETITKKNPHSITKLQMAYDYQTCNFHKVVIKHDLICTFSPINFILEIPPCSILHLIIPLRLRCQQQRLVAISKEGETVRDQPVCSLI